MSFLSAYDYRNYLHTSFLCACDRLL